MQAEIPPASLSADSVTVTSSEWSQVGCEISGNDLRLAPAELLAEYLRREYSGAFMKSNLWLGDALECPGYGGGPDTVEVLSDYHVVLEPLNHFQVTYDSEGRYASDNSWVPKKQKVVEDFQIIQTPWGWKIAGGWGTLRVSAKALLEHLTNSQVLPSPKIVKALKEVERTSRPLAMVDQESPQTEPSLDENTVMAQARDLFNRRNYADAQKSFQKVAFGTGHAMPQRAEAIFYDAESFRLAGQCQKAVLIYKALLRQFPESSWQEDSYRNIRACINL